MRATAEPIEGNRVRLSVEVDEPEVDRALNEVVRTLSRQVRVPGFRPGKVPRRVLEARMGGAGRAAGRGIPRVAARLLRQGRRRCRGRSDRATRDRHHGWRGERCCRVRRRRASSATRRHPRLRGSGGHRAGPGGHRRRGRRAGGPPARERRRADRGLTPGHRRGPGDHRRHGNRRRRRRGPQGERLPLRGGQRHPGSRAGRAAAGDQCRWGSWPSRLLPRAWTSPSTSGCWSRRSSRRSCPVPTDAWAAEASEFDTLAALRDDLERRIPR